MKRVCRKALAYLLAAIMVVGCYVPTYAAELRHESVSAGDVSSSDSADPSDEGIKDVSGGDTESPDGDTDSDGDIKPSVSDGDSNGTVSGGDALKKYYAKLLEPMNELLSEKTVQAVAYMADYINVWSAADWESDVITSVPSGHTVIIKKVETDGTFLWCYVSFAYDEVEYEGYIPRPYLACSDELFLEQEEVLTQAGIGNISTYATGYGDIDQFPESYQAALLALKKAHPNWVFVKQNTGLNWNDVIANEQGDKSLVPSNSPAAWKVRDYDKSWSVASEGIVKYYIDPRNALTENGIFQFEQLTYNASYHTLSAVQKCLDNTFMSGKMPGYDITYAQAFTQIGSNLHVSPFHLACRVYQEQGQGTSPLISGNYPGYIGYYNYFNIGASGNTNQMVITNGLARAKREGWNSRDKSIAGGAKIIAENYILKGQDTLYLQKFDVDASYNGLFSHQYMQNIIAPTSESSNVRKAYVNSGSLGNNFVFKIPVYNNMPDNACPIPSGVENAVLQIGKDGAESQITVKVLNVLSSMTGVKVAVWSDVGGQDDLQWYNLLSKGNNVWEATVPISNHKYSVGRYNIHLYADVNGNAQLIKTGAVNITGITAGNLRIEDQYEQQATFVARINGVVSPAGISEVRFAVWSEVNGQDDIIWYKAARDSEGWYSEIDTANHSYDSGNYQVHAYALDGRGMNVCIGTASVLMNQVINVPTFSIEKSKAEDGFIINLYDVKLKREYGGISIAVWSQTNGQDDIRWYKADSMGKNSCQIKVRIRDHKNNAGIYYAHAYYMKKDGSVGPKVFEISTSIVGLQGGKTSVSGVNQQQGTFRAEISSVSSPSGITNVKAAVWSQANGQDDIKWYGCGKNGNEWFLCVDTLNHGYDTGIYYIHFYGTDGRGITELVGTTQVEFSSKSFVTNSVIQNSSGSTITITLNNVKLGRNYSGITVPVWSDKDGQDDLKWYRAEKKNNNTYQVTVKISDHKNDTGVYNLHAYYIKNDGTTGDRICASKTVVGGISMGKATVDGVNQQGGTFRAQVESVDSPAGVSSVKAAVWSAANGQDDLKWYPAAKDGNQWYVCVDIGNHSYVPGVYYIHFYATDARGITSCVGMTQTSFNEISKPVTQIIKSADQSSFTVTVRNVRLLNGNAGIVIPVWSDQNGQDDLRWYKANKESNGTYSVKIPISNHKYNVGKYNVHIYYSKGDGSTGDVIDRQQVVIDGGKAADVSVVNVNQKTGKFRVQVSGVSAPADIKYVRAAVWSEINGQDDIVWYYATKEGNQWFVDVTTAAHGGDKGGYNIHIYAADARGVDSCIITTKVTM